jgi:hypothetical protein
MLVWLCALQDTDTRGFALLLKIKIFFSLLKLTARAEVSPLLPKYPDGFTFCSYVLSRGQGENESISAWEKNEVK